MTDKVFIFFIILIFCSISSFSQDRRAKLQDYLNQEIIVEENFSGQSITLIKENNEYFILRKFFGSGIPVVCSWKYKVVFSSDYQIAFSEIVESSDNNLKDNMNEAFLMCGK